MGRGAGIAEFNPCSVGCKFPLTVSSPVFILVQSVTVKGTATSVSVLWYDTSSLAWLRDVFPVLLDRFHQVYEC